MLYFRHKTDSDCYIFSLQADLVVYLIIKSQLEILVKIQLAPLPVAKATIVTYYHYSRIVHLTGYFKFYWHVINISSCLLYIATSGHQQVTDDKELRVDFLAN